jgi:ABC-type Co2+ transport system permease subunit
MVQFVISEIEVLMQAARDNYSVDPVVFLVIYLVSVPFFYYSLFRMIRALAKRLGKEIMLWSAIFLCANVAPFLYVLFFGRNLPWWVYGIIAVLIGQGVFSLIIKLRGRPAASAKDEG